jgi:hypothetical protein
LELFQVKVLLLFGLVGLKHILLFLSLALF